MRPHLCIFLLILAICNARPSWNKGPDEPEERVNLHHTFKDLTQSASKAVHDVHKYVHQQINAVAKTSVEKIGKPIASVVLGPAILAKETLDALTGKRKPHVEDEISGSNQTRPILPFYEQNHREPQNFDYAETEVTTEYHLIDNRTSHFILKNQNKELMVEQSSNTEFTPSFDFNTGRELTTQYQQINSQENHTSGLFLPNQSKSESNLIDQSSIKEFTTNLDFSTETGFTTESHDNLISDLILPNEAKESKFGNTDIDIRFGNASS